MNPHRSGTSGRIRLYQDQAELLNMTLNDLRHKLVISRAAAKQQGDEIYPHNKSIDIVDSILEELHRTMAEMGWPHGRSA